MSDAYDDLLGGYEPGSPAPSLPVWPESAPTAEMAAFLGVSARTLTDMRARGILSDVGRGMWPVQATVQCYLGHLREQAAGRGSDSVTAEKLRLTREQADKVALANAAARGEMVPLADVRREWAGFASDLRSALLAIPGRVSARMALDREAGALLESEVRDALREIANGD